MTTSNIPVENRPEYFRTVSDDLQKVEDLLSTQMNSSVHTITAVSSHILNAGGKRLRPALVLLSAFSCCGNYDPCKLISIAASTEMIHMATLMHDDVIDNSDYRRGRETANSRWNNQVSVLTGDYILAKSFWLLSNDGNDHIMRALANATTEMAEGEILQIEAEGDIDTLVKSYFPIIEGKTAAFMSACCRIGSIMASASPEQEDALADYGHSLGISFQITDDILDLVGDPDVIGKPVGGDIRDGKVTLPLILILERADAPDRRTIEQIIKRDDVTPGEIEYIRSLGESTGAVDGAREIAARYIKQAMDRLELLPESESRSCLEELARHILTRKR
ncbi:MAG: polyprenyl synthetase family protein [Armatimonadota bacterium]